MRRWSLLCGMTIPFLMMTRQDHSIEKMTAVWALLPVVAAEVSAASAGLLAPHLADADAFRIVILSYAIWAFSVPIALSMLVILVLRLIVHKPAAARHGGIRLAGARADRHGCARAAAAGRRGAPRLRPPPGSPEIGQVAAGIGVIGGTILWGYGLWWLALAVLMTRALSAPGMPFNLGWWGFIFPLGVYSVGHLGAGPAPPISTSCLPLAAGWWPV